MRDNLPPTPKWRWNDGTGENDWHNTPERTPGGMPFWPEAQTPRQRSFTTGGRATTLVGMLAVSIGANVALVVALLAVVLLARGGYFTASAKPTAGLSATTTVVSNPSPSPSVAPTAGWLQVGPTSVQLGCDDGQQTQFAVLKNTGTEDVQWQVVFSDSADNAGVTVSPRQGNVRAGTGIVLQIQSKRQSDSQQGVIRFDPDTSAAGAPPSLSYTTASCS